MAGAATKSFPPFVGRTFHELRKMVVERRTALLDVIDVDLLGKPMNS